MVRKRICTAPHMLTTLTACTFPPLDNGRHLKCDGNEPVQDKPRFYRVPKQWNYLSKAHPSQSRSCSSQIDRYINKGARDGVER